MRTVPARPHEAKIFPLRRNARLETLSPCPSAECVGIFIVGAALPDDFQNQISPCVALAAQIALSALQAKPSAASGICPMSRGASCDIGSQICTAPVRLGEANSFPSCDQRVRQISRSLAGFASL